MSNNCICGHTNPVGTELCENCGTQLVNDRDVDMRYEGAARRSRMKSRSLVDRVWNFFSSVNVGLIIILLTLVSSIFGTIFPQQHFITTTNPKAFYIGEYGIVGEIFYNLGFTRMYSSWWFKTILGMLAISLVIASLDRVIPLYKALKKQTVRKSMQFLSRQKIYSEWVDDASTIDSQLDKLEFELKNKGYRVRKDGQALLAEKARFSRWGPYVNHTGLILLITGALLMTSIPGWYLDEMIWVREGETNHVTGTDYYVKNNGFKIELYSEEELKKLKAENKPSVKRYQTDVTLYEKVGEKENSEPELRAVKDDSIIVNDPLRYEGVRLYQADYRLNDWYEMVFTANNKESNDNIGEFIVNLYNPEPSYELNNGAKVEILDYFPDFAFDQNKQPTTLSRNPNNPAFIFNIIGPLAPKGEKSWAIIGIPLEEIHKNNVYKANFQDLRTVNTTGLKISMNKGMPLIWLGAAIFMIGVIMGLYWHHRRIWIIFEGESGYMAAHTNKGWLVFQREIQSVTEKSGLTLTFKKVK